MSEGVRNRILLTGFLVGDDPGLTSVSDASRESDHGLTNQASNTKETFDELRSSHHPEDGTELSPRYSPTPALEGAEGPVGLRLRRQAERVSGGGATGHPAEHEAVTEAVAVAQVTRSERSAGAFTRGEQSRDRRLALVE